MADALARAKALGEQVETVVLEGHESIEAVDEEDAVVDAVAVESVTIPVDAEIEIKACSRRISDGSSSRRGRFYLRRRQHDDLLDRGAWYLFVVHDGDGEEIVASVALPSRVVDEIVTTWTDVGRGHRGIAQLTWSRLIDLED